MILSHKADTFHPTQLLSGVRVSTAPGPRGCGHSGIGQPTRCLLDGCSGADASGPRSIAAGGGRRPPRRLPRGPLQHVGGLGADRGLRELLQDVRQLRGNVDLLRAEHGVGKRHRSPQTGTRLGRIRVCCVEGEDGPVSLRARALGDGAALPPPDLEPRGGTRVCGGARPPGLAAGQEAGFARSGRPAGALTRSSSSSSESEGQLPLQATARKQPRQRLLHRRIQATGTPEGSAPWLRAGAPASGRGPATAGTCLGGNALAQRGSRPPPPAFFRPPPPATTW